MLNLCGTGALAEHVSTLRSGPASGAELVTKPAKAVIVSASKVAAGLDFTMWLCNGRVFSAGNPQFGQLGHGSDHEYNASDCEPPRHEVLLAPSP